MSSKIDQYTSASQVRESPSRQVDVVVRPSRTDLPATQGAQPGPAQSQFQSLARNVQRYTPVDLRSEAQQVRQLVAVLHKAYHAFSFYPFNHPTVQKFSSQLYEQMAAFFEIAPYLELRLDRFLIYYYEEQVFEEKNVSNNFVYLLYSDGIRKLIFYKGLTLEECFRFFAILHRCSGRSSLYDDVVTLMWEESFAHIRYFLVEDLSTTFLPSFAAMSGDYEQIEEKNAAPTVRMSVSGTGESDAAVATRSVKQLMRTRLELTEEEEETLQRLLREEETEQMHRFLELMTLIIQQHRESSEIEPLFRVLSQLQAIIVSVGSVEDMLLCYRYLGHIAQILADRGTPLAMQWSVALQESLPLAYSEEAIMRLVEAIDEAPQDKPTQALIAQYLSHIHPPTPDVFLLPFAHFQTEEGTSLWVHVMAQKFKAQPRKLMPGVLSSNEATVLGTCRVLGGIGREDSWPLLERASNHKSEAVRIQAFKAMLRLEATDNTTIKLLDLFEKYLGDGSTAIRHSAIEGLSELGPNAAFMFEKLFNYRTYESWSTEETSFLFEQAARLGNRYIEIFELIIELLLGHYNGRFTSRRKQEIPRIALTALHKENTPQAAQTVERIYKRGSKMLRRICEDIFKF